MLNFLNTTTKADFVVVDSQFPQKKPFAFRNAEINEYFKNIKNFSSYTMYPMLPNPDAGFGHGYGISYKDFLDNKSGYSAYYPDNGQRIHYLHKNKKYKFKLAYSFFLAETYVLLPFYEKNKIPFVFVLYPGGLFGLNIKASDNMIKKICSSKFFRGVITTQQITQHYLLSKQLCAADKVTYIYGGFVQFKKEDLKRKKYYQKHKKTFDICFVAAKYSEKGIDKGYDLFIKTAKQLCKLTDDIMFHVVGGFSEDDINVDSIKSRIKFYGFQQPKFLINFYAGMDIFLAPNRPFKLFDGSFDGFPLGIDAAYCGVALVVADEMKMNKHYIKDTEIAIIPLNPNKITERILHYYHNLDVFYKMAENGKNRTQQLFDINTQISERIKFFQKFVKLELG